MLLEYEEVITDNATIKYPSLQLLLLLAELQVKPAGCVHAFFDLCSFDVIILIILFYFILFLGKMWEKMQD